MKEKTARTLAKLRETSGLNKVIAIIVTIAIGVVGYSLVASRAASPFVAAEPEAATISGPAITSSDTTASGGRFVAFGGTPTGGAAVYYVDCGTGQDTNNGTSAASAWKSLSKASSAALKPGESLLLKKGCTFNGTLRTGSSASPWKGTDTNNIRVGAYGDGAAPIINNAVDNSANLDVWGSYITFDGLSLKGQATAFETGCQNTPKGYILGVAFNQGATYNTLTNSSLTGFYAGVFLLSGSANNRILGNNFTSNTMMSPVDRGGDNDAGAFGLLLWGDNNEIAYNNIDNNNACSYDYGRDGSAIEVYGGRGNVVHHNKATNDDAFVEMGDSRSADNSFMYNQYVSTLETSVFFITRGNGESLGPITGTKVYNNTAYMTGSQSQGMVCLGCAPNILSMKNNIIWAGWKALYADAAFDEGNNIYWRGGGDPFIQAPTISSTSKQQDPKFVTAGSNFRITAGSPAIDMASTAATAAGYTSDLDNMKVPAGNAPDIGAYEFGSTLASVPGNTSNGCQTSGQLGSASLTITAPAAGTYRVWSRIKAPDTTNNSYLFAVDGGCPVIAGDAPLTPGSWVWTNVRDSNSLFDLALTAGSHSLQFIGREPGVMLDRVMVTTDLGCTPTGLGDNCATVADTTAPSVTLTSPVAGQTVSGVTRLAVTTADTGGSGVTKVEYYLDNATTPFATATTSPFSYDWDTSQVSAGSHRLAAVASDGAGNKSTTSAITITLNRPANPPSVPTNLQSSNVTAHSVSLSWQAGSGGVVANYKVYRNNQFLATSTTASFQDTNVAAQTQYTYAVSAVDAAGNESAQSSQLAVTTLQAADTTPPTTPGNLSAAVVSATKITLQWSASTDSGGSGLAGYLVQRNGVIIAEVKATSFEDNSVLPGTSYTYAIYAVDGVRNSSAKSASKTVTTPALADSKPPTAPLGLTARLYSTWQINLSWQPSTDNVGVKNYRVFRNGQAIANTTTTSFADATVTANSTYEYYVVALDAAGNTSPASNKTSITVSGQTILTTRRIYPTDDTFVSRNNPTRKNGNRDVLRVDNSPLENSLLKFTVKSTSGKQVVSAKLRLFVARGGGTTGGIFYRAANNWNEWSADWNNAPKLDSTPLASLGSVTKGKWVEVDLSQLIKGDGTYSIGISAANNDSAFYNSKEAAFNRPQLFITTAK